MTRPLLMTRRKAIAMAAAVPFGAAAVFAAGVAEALRLAVLDDVPEEARRGIELGVREAQQTARLVGRELAITADSSAAFATITAAVRRPPGSPAAAMVVSLAPLADPGPCTFSVAASPQAAREATLRWTAEHGERADLAVVEWHPSLFKYGASELNERYVAAFGAGMSAAAWRGWFAVKALANAALRGAGSCKQFAAARFDGHKGRPLAFGPDGVLKQPLYLVSGDKVLGEAQ